VIPAVAHAFGALAGVALIATLASPDARAADRRPDVSVKTRAAELSVTLDDAIRANALLAADCLAEGRRWMAGNRADAERAWKDEPELFRGGQRWTYERDYAVESTVGGRYVSLVRTDYVSTGGAHPDTSIDTVIWDERTRKRMSIRPFFVETADGGPTLSAMAVGAVAALRREKKERGVDEKPGADWEKNVAPRLRGIGAVTLAPSTEPGKSAGLTFHYGPYAVGPYAEGAYAAFVPWQRLRPFLSPEGAAIFAGDLPGGAR
jgi:hypothetical protein